MSKFRTVVWSIVCGCAALMLSSAVYATACNPADFDGDGAIAGNDLLILLNDWGQPGETDLDDDGSTSGSDLLILLNSWGAALVADGTFPRQWITGGPDCGTEPDVQIHQYNDNTYILRQSLCTNFEAPFIYILFGDDRAIMFDTGAGNIDLAGTVDSVIKDHFDGMIPDDFELVVAHLHPHGDHVAGDSQMNGLPYATLVGLSNAAVQQFFGFTDWPTEIVQYDLGNRVLDVLAIPGHHSNHIAVYDAQTQILLTGDSFYPGRLFISNFSAYVESNLRLLEFTQRNDVCWILGTHIEMSTTPGVQFPIGSTSHPNERPLQLTTDHLQELVDALLKMQDSPQLEVHDDFVIFPL